MRSGFVLGITPGWSGEPPSGLGAASPELARRVRAALDAGVDAVLIREDALPTGLPAGADAARVFVHARIPDAVSVATKHRYGLHLPDGADLAAVRAVFRGPLSCSRHSPDAARDAVAAGADLVMLSPIWSPGSKPGDARPTLGAGVFDALRGLPVLALGGLDARRAMEVATSGARGVAAIGAIFGAHADAKAFVAAIRAAYSALSVDQR